MNPLIKQAVDSAKQALTESKTAQTGGRTPETTDYIKEIDGIKARMETAESKSRQLETENLRLQQDLSENTKFGRTLLEKLENYKTSTQTMSYSDELPEDELAEKLATKPKDTLLRLIRGEINREAGKYVTQGQEGTARLASELHGTKVILSKMALKEKYEGVDDEWADLVKLGDQYPAFTENVSDPKHLEAFYLMYKGFKGETPKKRNGKSDLEALLKEKLAAGLDSSATSIKPENLTEQQKRIASRYNLSETDYISLMDGEMDMNKYNGIKKERTNG